MVERPGLVQDIGDVFEVCGSGGWVEVAVFPDEVLESVEEV